MTCALYAFGDQEAAGSRLGVALGVACRPIGLHMLPDGESLPDVGPGASTALLYCSLDRPDAKLMPLLLAADALRRAGAERVVLVAPYMPYLRQDAVFAPGQPLSRDVIGAHLGLAFDRVVTVEPHLHRTAELTPVFGGTPVSSLSAADLLAAHIGRAGDPVIVGPDAESAPWVQRIARDLDAPVLEANKVRRGDRDVTVTFRTPGIVAGRRAVIVDDICSSGATLLAAIGGLRSAGAARIDIVVVHDLSRRGFRGLLRRAGASSMIATDSCGHRARALQLASLLAAALTSEIRP